jgi:hypothetical protein
MAHSKKFNINHRTLENAFYWRVAPAHGVEKAWLVQRKVTCPDVAAMWGCKIGAPEFRLLDHPDSPSSSYDFPSKKEAMAWAKKKGIEVKDLTSIESKGL